MEIRNHANDTQNKYPKLSQLNKKSILKNIPSKWLKLGISSFVINSIFKSKVLAENTKGLPSDPFVPLEGAVQDRNPINDFENIGNIWIKGAVISAIIFVSSIIIGIIYAQVKKKNKKDNIKLEKFIKILFIVSAITTVLSIIGKIVADNV